MKKHLLIVDDDFDTRFILKKILESEGYEVALAKDEPETFEVLSRDPINLILLDLKLGASSGFEICKKIKNNINLSHIPIISISVSQLEEDMIRAIEYGFVDFIGKPFNNKILTTKIKSVIRFKEEEEQLRKSRRELIKLNQYTTLQKELLSQEADFSRDLNQFLDAESKKSFIKDRFSAFLGARLFTIFSIDESKREFKLFVSNHGDLPPNLIVPVDRESIMYEVLRTRNHLFIRDFDVSPFRKSGRKKYTTRIVCSVPLISGHKTIGVLNVNDPEIADVERFDFEGRIVRTSQHLAVSLHNTILYEKVKDLSMRDSMTGLYNFRHFLETLRQEIDKAKRYKDPLSCIMLDIDNFKTVNDTHGHQVGDMVLKELARSVSISVRSSDIPARYGGDEFVIVLPKTDKVLALKLANRLMKLFSGKEIRISDNNGQNVKVTLSIGIAAFPDDTTDMDELMKMADEALYRAKAGGKNRIVEYVGEKLDASG
jgi:two-component system cell cycle response regulator